MNNRATILPTLGNACMLDIWLDLFEKVWGKEAGRLYVYIANLYPPGLDYLTKRVESLGGTLIFSPGKKGHGYGIRALLEQVKEEHVLIMEDDVFILQPGNVEKSFRDIENGTYDVVGSTRKSCTDGIVKALGQKVSLAGASPEHAIAECPNLWPALVFTKTKTLLDKTDRNYDPVCWPAGTTIKCLDYTTPAGEVGDTFVWTTIQLRLARLRFGYIHQHHNDLSELYDAKRWTNRPWVHVGSVSGEYDICRIQDIEESETLAHPLFVNPDARPELIRRLGFHKFIISNTYPAPLRDWHKRYVAGVTRTINDNNIDPNFLAVCARMFDGIIGSAVRNAKG